MKTMTLIFSLMAANLAMAFEFPTVNQPWLRAAPPNVKMMAAYFELENNTANDIKLVGAFSPAFGMTELHKSIEENGQYRMEHQPELNVAVGEALSFQPGGLHVMLMMPEAAIKAGEQVRICLIYQDQTGEKHVQHLDFPVQKEAP